MLMPCDVIDIFRGGDYPAVVARAVEVMARGGVVVLPTETVYGACGLLCRAAARDRLRALRPGAGTGPLTIHLAGCDQASDYLTEVGEIGRRLMRKLWPGPVGLLFDVPASRRAEVAGRLGVAESDLYESGTITLRCPDHQLTEEVLSKAGGAVVATASGALTDHPADAEAIAGEFGGKVDLILFAGPSRYAKPSTLVKVNADGYEIVRAGVYDQRIIERLLRTTILFVCSGNTCRSPMAEGLARRVLAERMGLADADLEKHGVSVTSAGSFAIAGAPPAAAAVTALAEAGIDIAAHRSRPLSIELIHQADLIVAMSHSHLAAVGSIVPSALEKTITLDPSGDIEDPIGGGVEVYRTLTEQLRPLIQQRLDELVTV